MLAVISSIVIIVCSFTNCSRTMDAKIKNIRSKSTLIFYSITDKKDTCIVIDFLDSSYNKLNIKVVDCKTFDSYFMKKVLNNEVIEVSEEYYRKEKKYRLTPVNAIDEIYTNNGLDSLLNYLNKYTINRLQRDDIVSFKWAAYILWQNDIYISLDNEISYFYIDEDYR